MDTRGGDGNAGARLKELRQGMGLSQQAFGEPLGFPQTAVSAFEKGKVPLKKADALVVEYRYGIRHEWLLFGREPRGRSPMEEGREDAEVLRIYRALSPQGRLTWLGVGRLLAQDAWDGRTDRRAGDRRRGDRRAPA